MRHRQLDQKLAELEEGFREIDSLASLYEQLVEGAENERQLEVQKEEAKFARDRLLRLSLHAKNMIKDIETKKLKS